MVPLKLTLQNFLSYREASLDFQGLHTACICGANGAGKSSLLEAITWVIWGESRAIADDDLIHGTETDLRVDFEFQHQHQIYKVTRIKPRGRTGKLDFQIQQESGKFKSIAAKGMKATQQTIIDNLKLDYDTFVNAAYLRQGRADEFMLRKPTERKKLLANLLKLDQYEVLAQKAKDLSRQYKGQREELEQALGPMQEQMAKKPSLRQRQTGLKKELKTLTATQERAEGKLQEWLKVQHQRSGWEQQLNLQRQTLANLDRDREELQRQINGLAQQQQELRLLMEQQGPITQNYHCLLQLRQEEETLSEKAKIYHQWQERSRQLEQQLTNEINQCQLQINTANQRHQALLDQQSQWQKVLRDEERVNQGLKELQRVRQRLEYLDSLQGEVAPLLQQKQQLQFELDRTADRLRNRIEQLQGQAQQLVKQIAAIGEKEKTALGLQQQLLDLEKKRTYQTRVKDKRQERRAFKSQLEDKQRQCEEVLAELRQKLDQLNTPHANCPLCEQGLDGLHREMVVHKTQTQQQTLQEQLWMLKEQAIVTDQEMVVLREEYYELNDQLDQEKGLQQQYANLMAELGTTEALQHQVQQIHGEIKTLERSLHLQQYGEEIRGKLQHLSDRLVDLDYDEETHGLIRGEEKRWRWAEIEQVKLDQARKSLAQVEQELPQLHQTLSTLQRNLKDLRNHSPLHQEISQVTQELNQLGYSIEVHQRTSQALRDAQCAEGQYQALERAEQQLPVLQERIEQLTAQGQRKQEEAENLAQQLELAATQLAAIADNSQAVADTQALVNSLRNQREQLLADQGAIEQALVQLEQLERHHQEQQQRLKELNQKCLVYQELTQAFGKNGIQALMIENILPQLEAETNHILGRLTGNQFHVQFVTQKQAKASTRKNPKMIDTLEILIADAGGTRSYETYSGGEGFRINFSIRLALARLLAHRSGTALQMLIVDEGFGTQDGEGCDRLIAAINAIAPDFACILAVTHMPQFKEAFQTRIEVVKGADGSQLHLVS